MSTTPYQDALHFGANDSITLSSFYEGQNTLLLETCKKAIATMRHESYFIFAPPGSGKTHLITALFNSIENRAEKAFFMDLSIAVKLSPALLNINPYPVMFVDNVDAICAKSEFEDAFFALYNRWFDYGTGPLFITAVESADSIAFLRRDLNTRLGNGLTFPLLRLNEEDCARALELKAIMRGFTLAPKVAQYLVRHKNAYMPALVDILDRLDLASLQRQREITIPFIKEILGPDL
ncbi:DnaA-homolog protein hda [Anaerobiospirillum thomasii]|uniref:HdaA/DnaA family protein n=1 Tax=Anaerobiospirillum thomasii TaxID=179995 RepID=UPI000D8EC7C6|nr:DnaA/Hda family protein [Anaerobiospirillum thomasii]SPT68596.1 DnaA-homolog protein hda [Anaerobiospirillum thomasii]